MNQDKILYRILLGYYYIYIDNIEYKVKYPTLDIKYRGEILYDNIIEENKFDKRLLTEEEIIKYLENNDIWKKSDQENLDKCKKILDDSKIELYINYSNEKTRKNLKDQISDIKKDINKLLNKKNSMNYLGINEHALSVKNEFIIMNTIYDNNNNLVFNNPYMDTYEHQKLQSFIREIIDHSLEIDTIRKIAKSETWRSTVACINIQKNINELNDDYKYLISLYKMYDNVRQHPDCPSEDIINDDDALDGWFLHTNKKAEKEKKKNAILNKLGGNTKNAGEVFVMTDDIQETKDIYDLNDDTAKYNVKELISLANQKLKTEKDSISWGEIPFVQRDIQNKLSEMQGRK